MNGQFVSEGLEAEFGSIVAAPGNPRLAVGTRRPEIDLLARVPLFAGLPLSHLHRVAALTEDAEYHPGRLIVRKGDPAGALYVIVEGLAKVVKGKIVTAQPEAELGPGDFFGELALLDGDGRAATVVAATPMRAIRIQRSAFLRLLRKEPGIALKILEGMAGRTRKILGATSP
jgi:CRP-like cAMP-binding protein